MVLRSHFNEAFIKLNTNGVLLEVIHTQLRKIFLCRQCSVCQPLYIPASERKWQEDQWSHSEKQFLSECAIENVESHSHCFPWDADILFTYRFWTVWSFMVTRFHYPKDFVVVILGKQLWWHQNLQKRHYIIQCHYFTEVVHYISRNFTNALK